LDQEALSIVLAFVALGGTLGGTALGAHLNVRAARGARDEERRYAAKQRRRDEEREAATLLDEALADAEREAGGLVRQGTPGAGLARAAELFDPAFARYSVRLTNETLASRLYAVSAFLIGAQVAAPTDGETIDYGLLEGLRRTVANARVSLDAYRRDAKLPSADVLDRALITDLLREGEAAGEPFGAMRQWLMENPPSGAVKAYLEA
jgi:hypothetical protein